MLRFNLVYVGAGGPSGAAGGDLGGTYPNPSVLNLTIAGQTRGDLWRRGASAWTRLALGAAGALLQSDGTDPAWLARGTALQVLRVNAGGTEIEWAAASGGGMAVGHAWQRTSAATAGAGASFLDQDTLITYTSTGAYWGVDLGSGQPLATDLAGLTIGSGWAVLNSIDLSAYALGAATMAMLFTWAGPIGAVYSILGTIGNSFTGTSGINVYLKVVGGDHALVVFTGAGPGETVLTTFVGGLPAGLHCLAVSPVSHDFGGGAVDAWVWSFDGSAAAYVAMVAAYAAPTASAEIGFGSRNAHDLPLVGTAHEMALWTAPLSGAQLAAITTLPGTPTYRLPLSSGSGAPAVYVAAHRYSVATPTMLFATGLPAPLGVSGVTKVTY